MNNDVKLAIDALDTLQRAISVRKMETRQHENYQKQILQI